MKALITVIGQDSVGIIGGVCTKLASMDINILDISQTVMHEYFTMMMFVDISESGKNMDEISDVLNEYGKEKKLEIRIQRTDIFDAMYKI